MDSTKVYDLKSRKL